MSLSYKILAENDTCTEAVRDFHRSDAVRTVLIQLVGLLYENPEFVLSDYSNQVANEVAGASIVKPTIDAAQAFNSKIILRDLSTTVQMITNTVVASRLTKALMCFYKDIKFDGELSEHIVQSEDQIAEFCAAVLTNSPTLNRKHGVNESMMRAISSLLIAYPQMVELDAGGLITGLSKDGKIYMFHVNDSKELKKHIDVFIECLQSK